MTFNEHPESTIQKSRRVHLKNTNKQTDAKTKYQLRRGKCNKNPRNKAENKTPGTKTIKHTSGWHRKRLRGMAQVDSTGQTDKIFYTQCWLTSRHRWTQTKGGKFTQRAAMKSNAMTKHDTKCVVKTAQRCLWPKVSLHSIMSYFHVFKCRICAHCTFNQPVHFSEGVFSPRYCCAADKPAISTFI